MENIKHGSTVRASKPKWYLEPHHHTSSIPIFQKDFKSRQPTTNQKTHLRKRVAEENPQGNGATRSIILSQVFSCQRPQTAHILLENSIPETPISSQNKIPDTEMMTDSQ